MQPSGNNLVRPYSNRKITPLKKKPVRGRPKQATPQKDQKLANSKQTSPVKESKISRVVSSGLKEYRELTKYKPGDQKIHFYGVVLDAQFPHKSFKSDKFICSLKICDPTCSINKEEGTIQYFNLVIFANRIEDLPITQRVGDIIRVHRAFVNKHND